MKIDYQKTIIYKLCCKDPTIKDIYVGHTTNFKIRNNGHRSCCNNPNGKQYNHYKYQFIRDNGGYENWNMIIIKDYPCNNKRDAEKEENRIMIDLGATLNICKAYVSKEEKKEYRKNYNNMYNKKYSEENKEILCEKKKEYYQENRTEIIEKLKKDRKNNPEKYKQIDKRKREKHKDKLSQKAKQYYQENKTEKIEKAKEYYEENRIEILEKIKEKVNCEYCNFEITKSHLKRHQKTQKCIKIQNEYF